MKRIAKCLFWIIVFSMVVTVPVQAASKKTQKITVKAGEDINKEYGDKAFALGAQAKTKLKYKSSAPGVVKVNKKGATS